MVWTQVSPRVFLPFFWYVLNALRHQWFGHTLNRLDVPTLLDGAQRLTASMVWTLALPSSLNCAPLECSTPYGINGLDTYIDHLEGKSPE